MSRVRGVLCVAAAAMAVVGSIATGAIGAPSPKLARAEFATTTSTTTTSTTIQALSIEADLVEITTSTASTVPPTTTPPRPKPRIVKTAAAKPKPPGDGLHDENKVDTRPVPKLAGLPLGSPFIGAYSGPDIEGFARYEGQSTCDPTPKAGTLALRDILLARYPSTKSLGVSRNCDVGGQSEHKEGRAFDWGTDILDATDVAAVNDFLTALLATDAEGHRYALARRMGIMYVIWNRQIWGAYSAKEGWRPYDGPNPHTGHVHISLSWAGGRGETSFFSGTVVKGLPDFTTTTTTRPRRTTTTWTRRTTSTTTAPAPTSTSTSVADGDETPAATTTP